MASLKEIKGRINSVTSTQKITSAMKMVASAKLRKAQSQIESFLPYETKLMEILHAFLSFEVDTELDLSAEREVKRVAIVAISSNSSLCGAFNSNIQKLLKERLDYYQHLGREHIELYPIGKKIEEFEHKTCSSYPIMGSFIDLMDKPNFEGATAIADRLINDFLHHKIDRVELLYNHFKSTAAQVPTNDQFLPLVLQREEDNKLMADYLIEPDKQTILESLLPKSLHSKIYAALLDSAAAEQAARTVAMQIATDNASDLLDELTIQFNKQRQQAITSELLDIIGGSEALK